MIVIWVGGSGSVSVVPFHSVFDITYIFKPTDGYIYWGTEQKKSVIKTKMDYEVYNYIYEGLEVSRTDYQDLFYLSLYFKIGQPYPNWTELFNQTYIPSFRRWNIYIFYY